MRSVICSLAGQFLSALLTVTLACLLTVSTWTLAQAKAASYQVAYEGAAKGLVTADDDFFAHFGTLLPGDTATGTVQVRNNGTVTQSLGFRADAAESSSTGPSDLLQKLRLTVRSGKAKLYDGPLSADELGSTVSLGSFAPKAQAKLTFAVTCPADLGNAYALSAADVRWVFTAMDESSAGIGTDDPKAPATTPASSTGPDDGGVRLGKTGASTAAMVGAAALLALVGALSLSRVGTRRKPAPRRPALGPLDRRGFGTVPAVALLACGALSLALVAAGGTALAHYVDATDSTVNELSVGENAIKIEEEFPAAPNPQPGSKLTKRAWVTNTGNSPCYVRALVTFSSKEAEDSATLDYDRDNWKRGEDGYDYYQHVLQPGQSTPALFSHVALKGSFASQTLPFDLDVKAESTYADPELDPTQAFAQLY
ncbi:MAG: hypothetical protein Q4D06_01400 [Coriobacteriia bacterium]|nr:hypothetical protein [Coriobacteriia bacterium]